MQNKSAKLHFFTFKSFKYLGGIHRGEPRNPVWLGRKLLGLRPEKEQRCHFESKVRPRSAGPQNRVDSSLYFEPLVVTMVGWVYWVGWASFFQSRAGP